MPLWDSPWKLLPDCIHTRTSKSRKHWSCSSDIFFSSFAIWVAHCEKRTECLLPGQHSDEGQCTDFLTGTPNLKNHLTWFREMRRKVKVRSMSTNSLQTISFWIFYLLWNKLEAKVMVELTLLLANPTWTCLAPFFRMCGYYFTLFSVLGLQPKFETIGKISLNILIHYLIDVD